MAQSNLPAKHDQLLLRRANSHGAGAMLCDSFQTHMCQLSASTI